MTSIYILLKNNSVFYVGKTINPSSRLYEHKINYGHNIEMLIIDKVKNNKWKFWEKHYIALYKSWGFKLKNKNDGGGGTTKGTPQKTAKLLVAKSKPILQYDISGNFIKEWSSAKQVANHLGLTNGSLITYVLKGKSPTAYNSLWKYKTESYPTKIKIPIHKHSKPILQYDIKGNLIKEWSSAKEASIHLNKPSAAITECCKGIYNRKSAYGYVWKLKH